ncbi:MAG: glycosyltransferase [bacterium]
MNAKRIIVFHYIPSWLFKTETWLYNQVRFLPPEIENHIVCEKTENLDQFFVPNIHALIETSAWRYFWDKGVRKLGIRQHLDFLVAQARIHHAHVLHSHFGNVGWANRGAAKLAGLKHVVTFYGVDVNYVPKNDSRWHDRYQMLFDQTALVLCEGPHMAQCVVALGCPKNKVRVHHLGVRVEKIAFRPRIWNPAEPLRVLIAASFREKKGIPFALEALARLQSEVPFEVTIIGDAGCEERSQIEKRKILSLIDKYNLKSKIHLLGYQSHEVFFEQAYTHHVFLSPSVTASDGDTEGGAPVSIIEMAASGMPIVSTTHCDIPEVIKNGVSGLLAPERDVDGLVHHLKWLVNHPSRWKQMVEAGRRHVETGYDARVQGEILARVYQEVVNA